MYFETTIKGAVENGEGLLKIETLRLLLDAETFAEAEEKTYKFWEDLGVKSMDLKANKKSLYVAVKGLTEDCEFFKFVTEMIIPSDNGKKDKKLRESFLIGATSIEEAEETGRNELVVGAPWPTSVIEVKKTNILEVQLEDEFEEDDPLEDVEITAGGRAFPLDPEDYDYE